MSSNPPYNKPRNQREGTSNITIWELYMTKSVGGLLLREWVHRDPKPQSLQ